MRDRAPVPPLFSLGVLFLLASAGSTSAASSVAPTAPGSASIALPPHAGAPPVGDVRLSLVELMLQERFPAALALTEQALAMPADQRPPGLQYLHAHLLEKEGRQQEAADAFGAAMAALPVLRPYARYRLALSQARLGHPEVAAGLLATVLGDHPPAVLTAPAIRLLRGAIGAGGDCRVLAASIPTGSPNLGRRQLEPPRRRARQRPAAGAVGMPCSRPTCRRRGARGGGAPRPVAASAERDERRNILIGGVNAHRELRARTAEPAWPR